MTDNHNDDMPPPVIAFKYKQTSLMNKRKPDDIVTILPTIHEELTDDDDTPVFEDDDDDTLVFEDDDDTPVFEDDDDEEEDKEEEEENEESEAIEEEDAMEEEQKQQQKQQQQQHTTSSEKPKKTKKTVERIQDRRKSGLLHMSKVFANFMKQLTTSHFTMTDALEYMRAYIQASDSMMKRRLYDIVNVLIALGLVEKDGKRRRKSRNSNEKSEAVFRRCWFPDTEEMEQTRDNLLDDVNRKNGVLLQKCRKLASSQRKQANECATEDGKTKVFINEMVLKLRPAAESVVKHNDEGVGKNVSIESSEDFTLYCAEEMSNEFIQQLLASKCTSD